MGWVTEDLTPTPDGTNKVFFISSTPAEHSVRVMVGEDHYHPTTRFPIGGRFRRKGLEIRLGNAPAFGQHAWVTYFAI